MDIKDIKHIAGDLQKYLDDNQFDKIKTILDIANSCIDNKTIFNIIQSKKQNSCKKISFKTNVIPRSLVAFSFLSPPFPRRIH